MISTSVRQPVGSSKLSFGQPGQFRQIFVNLHLKSQPGTNTVLRNKLGAAGLRIMGMERVHAKRAGKVVAHAASLEAGVYPRDYPMPPSKKPIAILCDVNGTLFPLTALGKRMHNLGLREDDVELWFSRVLRDGISLSASGGFARFNEIGRHHIKEMLDSFQVATASLDSDLAADDILNGFDEVEAFADVEPGFEILKKAGIKIATFTNGSIETTESFLRRSNLKRFVSDVMDVSGPGRWKPHPEAYQYAVAQLGLKLDEVMLVAAHPWDVNGAKQAGLQAAYISRGGATYPHGIFAAPDLIASSFENLAEMLY